LYESYLEGNYCYQDVVTKCGSST